MDDIPMTDPVVNDFSIRIATPNGTGSASSNDILFRALFHMGIAACAKNLFPSNIQGLPTWYQIRVSPQGYQTSNEHSDVLLPLNPATISKDLDEFRPGKVVIHNLDDNLSEERLAPFVSYGVPFDTLARKNLKDALLRPKLKNLIYVGAVTELLSIPHESVKAAIASVFAGKQKVVDINWSACELGINYAREHFDVPCPYQFARANQTEGKILTEGNEAAALGAVYGGCTVLAWYPITPATSVSENIIAQFRKTRIDEDGRQRYAVIQAEDELAAIGMCLGAGWAGARAATSSSGPGISLMAENLGFGYHAEIPCVIYDIVRVGPSTGLPTRTQQSDLLQVAFLSHGDTRFPMLFPAGAKEAFEFSWKAFDIADRLQTPIFYMSDLDIGMNVWVDDEFTYPDVPLDRGKILTDEKLAELGEWGRYKDVDGDGIAYRSLPGLMTDPRAAYFTRGSGHDAMARYTEEPAAYKDNLDRLSRKIDGAVAVMPAPVTQGPDTATLGVIAFGSSDPAIREVLASQPDLDMRYLRVRSYPFHDQVREFIAQHDRVLVIEQNQQAQLASMFRMDYPELATKLESALYYGGLPLSPEFVLGELQSFAGKVQV